MVAVLTAQTGLRFEKGGTKSCEDYEKSVHQCV